MQVQSAECKVQSEEAVPTIGQQMARDWDLTKPLDRDILYRLDYETLKDFAYELGRRLYETVGKDVTRVATVFESGQWSGIGDVIRDRLLAREEFAHLRFTFRFETHGPDRITVQDAGKTVWNDAKLHRLPGPWVSDVQRLRVEVDRLLDEYAHKKQEEEHQRLLARLLMEGV